jgi:hypothetical protein
MTKHLLITLAALLAIAAPRAGRAQTFKVEKFDIKGDGGTDYVAVESETGRVFVSRGTHMMVVEAPPAKCWRHPDILGVHGAGIATKAGHGFTTNGGDQTVTMFDLKTLVVPKKITAVQGSTASCSRTDNKIIPNHSRPIGTLTALDPASGDIVATVELEDTAPEARLPTARATPSSTTSKNMMQVIDVKTWKAVASAARAVRGPDRHRRQSDEPDLSGCNRTSVVVDPDTGSGRHTERIASMRSVGIRRASSFTFRTAARATSPSYTRTAPTNTLSSRP